MDTLWRDVWHETQAALEHLRDSIETVQGLERTALRAQQAQMLSDRVEDVLALMEKTVAEMRSQVHAADVQLTAATEALMAESVLHRNTTHFSGRMNGRV